MDKVIVYVDDADYALQFLQAHLASQAHPPGTPTQWVLVGCAPRVTRQVSRWGTHSARENWRQRWAEKTFARLLPLLSGAGDPVTTLLDQPDLAVQTALLVQDLGPARVLDARRPKQDHGLQPVALAQPQPHGLWGLLTGVTGTGWLVMAD